MNMLAHADDYAPVPLPRGLSYGNSSTSGSHDSRGIDVEEIVKVASTRLFEWQSILAESGDAFSYIDAFFETTNKMAEKSLGDGWNGVTDSAFLGHQQYADAIVSDYARISDLIQFDWFVGSQSVEQSEFVQNVHDVSTWSSMAAAVFIGAEPTTELQSRALEVALLQGRSARKR